MTDTVHKGQKQVVEGSAVGEFYVVPKFAYNCLQQIEYIGEAKVGVEDHTNRHFIQKMIYDCVGNLLRIVTAINRANANSDNINLVPELEGVVRIQLNNGDFTEASEKDAIHLKTSTQELMGEIVKKNSDTEVLVKVDGQTVYVLESNASINKNDLVITFKNENTKDYTKRKWTNRERYFYDTI